jgi:hypothetical protein
VNGSSDAVFILKLNGNIHRAAHVGGEIRQRQTAFAAHALATAPRDKRVHENHAALAVGTMLFMNSGIHNCNALQYSDLARRDADTTGMRTHCLFEIGNEVV